MSKELFQQVVSLGPNCRSKFHIEKLLGPYVTRGGVFDWQRTPSAAVIEYLRRDFQGVFERRDLIIVDGHVRNWRFGTSHKHAFPGELVESQLDQLYPSARQKHDYCCRVTRSALENGYSTVFVLCAPVVPEHLGEIAELIKWRRPGRRFVILQAPEGDHDDDWDGDHEVWAKHLSSFTFTPPLSVMAKFHRRRLLKKLRDLKPGKR